MKKIIIGLIAVLSVANIWATDPPKKQKVYSVIKQKRSIEWYQEQVDLWRTEVTNSPNNADAWLNLYAATRNIKILGGNKFQSDLNKIVQECEKNVPNSFEFNHIKYWNGSIDGKEELKPYLFKAYELEPDRPDTYPAMFTHYYLRRNKSQIKEFSKRWYASNDMSSGIYAWAYNLLMSCEEKAILITTGDNDTYPTLVLQNEKEIRKDIAVINLYLIAMKDFQDKYFQELGIPLMTKVEKDFANTNEYHIAICKHIRKHSNRPFYYTPGMWWNSSEDLKKKLYVVGLAYKYSEERFDNVAVLKKNYEKYFLKDYLSIEFQNDISQEVVDRNKGTYLMPLLTLYNHYKEAEQVVELKRVEGLINKIAEQTGQMDQVNHIIKPNENNVVSAVITDPRDAYYGMLKIDDTLHASQCEISNFTYDRFLLDLLKQQRYDDLNIAKHSKVDWKSLLLPQYKDLTYKEYFEHGKPDEDRFPISNISYEAAVMYCDWLTNIYNNLHHKKKQFKKVLFRLPTEKEWEYLARKGRSSDAYSEYPWGNLPYTEKGEEKIREDIITNGRGCYLANVQTNKKFDVTYPVNPNKTCPAHDGGIFPVLNHSYHPNDAGLYCMIGNVAEMTSVKGVAKGGGWNTPIEEAKISKTQKYEGPDPNVGFRVVMVVIEK